MTEADPTEAVGKVCPRRILSHPHQQEDHCKRLSRIPLGLRLLKAKRTSVNQVWLACCKPFLKN